MTGHEVGGCGCTGVLTDETGAEIKDYSVDPVNMEVVVDQQGRILFDPKGRTPESSKWQMPMNQVLTSPMCWRSNA